MAVAAKVRKPRPGVGARQEDNNEDDRFLNGTLPSPREHRAASKALRDQTPREDRGKWKPSPNRPDPVDLLIASNEDESSTWCQSGMGGCSRRLLLFCAVRPP
jgi:hypothetical protein